MKDIREITQEVLDGAFFGTVPVYPEDAEVAEIPPEYITHEVAYSLADDWANGKTTVIREGVDITYCCQTPGQKPARLRQIQKVMEDNGYITVEGFADIPRGEVTGYYGAMAEFVLYRVVT